MLGFGTRFWINVLGRVTPLAVSFLFVVFSTNERTKELVFLAAIVALTVVEYFGFFRPLKHLEEVVREQFDFYFEPFVNEARFDGKKADIRVNIMLVRWHFIDRHFYQYYQQGMAGHPDANFHFSVRRGLCGYAFRKNSHEVVYRDLREDTPAISTKKYKWSQEHFDMTQHVKAVATIPLYRERRSLRGYIKHKYFGVLNVDATNDAGAEFLADNAIQEQIKGFARFVQISLV